MNEAQLYCLEETNHDLLYVFFSDPTRQMKLKRFS